MMKRILQTVLFFSSLSVFGQLQYPATEKRSQVDDYHGVTISDPYRWLENDTSSETKEWVGKQKEVTDSYFSAIPFRERIKSRMAEVFNYPRYGIPFRKGEYLYFHRNSGLQNQSVLYRRKGHDTTSELIIDPNIYAADGTTRMTRFEIDRDGRYAVWGISRAGSDWQTLFVSDLEKRENLPDSINWVKVSDIAWQGKGFYYSRYPVPPAGMELSSKNERHQVWYHRLGTSQDDDSLVFDDSVNVQRFHTAYTSEDERFLFLSVSDRGKGFTGNALFYSDSEAQDKHFKPVVAEVGQYLYGLVGVLPDNKFLIATNHEAPNTKIMLFDPARPEISSWKTVVPETKNPLESADMAGGKIFVRYLKDVASKVYMYSTSGKRLREVMFPGPGKVAGFAGLVEDTTVFYSYTSLNFPTHIYQYHISNGKSTLFYKPEIHFDPESYTTTQQFYQSKDGTRVPLFLVHKKGLPMNGNNPTILYGYGGFNISISPGFTTALIPWLEMGGVYAVANLRGGSEYGEKWHEAGMLQNKQNVFDDFIAAAEHLIRKKYTSPKRLAIRGASNGGLLVAAVINQRPELFQVAIPELGVMDMLRFHKFTIGWNWISEYGTSDNKSQFEYLIRYSPIQNIRPGREYPATLVVTADHDDRVVPAHSFKYVATMQDMYKGSNPILMRVDSNSGHGSVNIMKSIELSSDIYSFIIQNMGLSWNVPSRH